MDLLHAFKEYLFSQKNAPSKITIKNYAADIRKFISWYEDFSQATFTPVVISYETIAAFKERYNQTLSTPSLERHLSSLRKFFTFLQASGYITHSPFDEVKTKVTSVVDPWNLQQFKNYLYLTNASHLTVKNYIIDLKQFFNWLKEVAPTTITPNQINANALEEYKTRLYSQKIFSPLSINRKLSSLRKYINWSIQQGYMQNKSTATNIKIEKEAQQQVDKRYLESFHLPQKKEPEREKQTYSSIPPVRLFQKLYKLQALALEAALILPLAKASLFTVGVVEAMKGTRIFKKQQLTRVVSSTQLISPDNVKNLPKGLYAPLSIATTSFSPTKKAFHYLRHARPNWYKRYQSYTISTYFNIAILSILIGATAFGLYTKFILEPRLKGNALAALPTAPPRILSFQGRLTDSSNNPITSRTDLRFAIYNDSTATGSALLWQENLSVTPDTDGIFSTQLGNNTAIPSSLFSQNASLYIGVTVGQTPELSPRQQLATVAYAANAETLQGLTPITAAGAGTSNVVLALDSSGNLTIGGSANPTFQATGGQFKLSGQPLVLTTNSGSSGNIQLSPDGLGQIDIQRPLINTTANNNIPSAAGAVEVDDLLAVLATSSGQSAFTINQNSTGPLISASTSGVSKFTVDNNGNLTAAGNITGNTIFTGNGTTYFINNGTSNLNSLILTNNFTVSGNVSSNLIPSTSDTYNLGSASNEWNNIYVKNIISPSSGGTSGYWQLNSGALALTNITNDLLVGGTGTSSAKFQVFGLTGSATSSGNVTFNSANPIIQTTNMSPLVIGSSTTGSLQLAPKGTTGVYVNGNGNVGVGTTTPTALLDIAGNASESGNLTFRGGGAQQVDLLNKSSLAFNTSVGGDTGITTNRPALYIDSTGNVSFGVNSTVNNALGLGVIGSVSSPKYFLAAQNSSTIGIANYVGRWNGSSGTYWGIGPATGSNDNNLRIGGVVNQGNSQWNGTQNLNLLLGGQEGIGQGTNTSLLGTLDVRNVTGTLATASISGQTSFAALTVDNSGSGDLFTASSSGLNRFVITQNGNVGVGTTNPSLFNLQVNGNVGPNSTDAYDLGASGTEWRNLYVKNIISTATSGQNGFWQLNSGVLSPATTTNSLAIGQTTALANSGLDVEYNSLGNATAVINNSGGAGDIFTASSAGTPEFRIDEGGNVGIQTNGVSLINGLRIGNNNAVSSPAFLAITQFSSNANGAATIVGNWNNNNFWGIGEATNNGSDNTLRIGLTSSTAGGSNALGNTWLTNQNLSIILGGTPGTSAVKASALDIEQNSLGNSALVVNNSGGSGDIFTASSAGQTVFTLGSTSALFQEGTLASIGTRNNTGATGSETNSYAVANAIGDTNTMVPNGGFESATSGFADGWVKSSTSSGSLAALDTTNNIQGNNGVDISATSSNKEASIYSACFPIEAGTNYNGNIKAKQIAAGSGANPATLQYIFESYTSESNCQTNTSQTAYQIIATDVNPSSSYHFLTNAAVTAPNNTTWGRIEIYVKVANATSGTYTYLVDGAKFASTGNNGLDYAENYPVDPQNQPGAADVVSLESVNGQTMIKPSDHYQDNGTIGVISTNPGQVLDDGLMPDQKAAVALAGRVPVKVSTKNGPIHTGDYLTSSDIPGVAVKATTPGLVIGTAMGDDTDIDSTHITQITVFIKNTYYVPAQTATNTITTLMNLPQQAIATVEAKIINAAEAMITNLTATTASINTLTTQHIFSPIAEVDQLHTNVISPLSQDSQISVDLNNSQLTVHASKDASSSAVATIDNKGNESLAGNLQVDKDATISGTLYAGRIHADQIDGLNTGTESAHYITNITNVYQTTASANDNSNSVATNSASATVSTTPTPIIPIDIHTGVTASPSANDITSNLQTQNSYADIASFSGYLSYVPNLGSATFDAAGPDTNTQAPTTFSDVGVAGTLSVGSRLVLADNTVNVLGADLELQPLRQGGVSIADGQVYIDSNGNLTVKGDATFMGNLAANIISPIADHNLTISLNNKNATESANSLQPQLDVKNASGSGVFAINQLGDIIASGAATISKLNLNLAQPAMAVSDTEQVASGSAGTAEIAPYQKEVTIDNSLVTDKSLIYITPVGDPSSQIPYLLRQVANKSFTVGIAGFSATSTIFNWLIIN